MSDTYNPQPWLSPTDQPQRPVSVAVNVTLPNDANQADTGVLMRVAQSIVQGNTTQIDRFIAAQRQQQAINPVPYKDVSTKMQGMRARWRMNNGLERLDLEVFPAGGEEAFADTTDTNLDGYIAWVHGEPGGPFNATPSGAPGDVNPYNIFMNGYLIEQNYTPVLPCGGYVVLFGKTAMLDPSHVGNEEHIKIVGPTQKPHLVVPPKGWGSYPSGSNGLVNQGQYAKTFGYWILDWTNILNPCQYFDFFGGSVDNWATVGFGQRLGPPVFDRGMYFADPRKSPLLSRGKNVMGVFLSPSSFYFGQGAELITVDVMISEFYDRGAYRKASQSWTITPDPRTRVAVNDKPMIFGVGGWSGAFTPGMSLTFNLDPSTTKAFAGTNAGGGTQMGPHDILRNVFQITDPKDALTDDQRAQYDAWVQQVQAASKAFNDRITNEIQAWKDKWNETENLKQLNRAEQIEFFLSTMQDASGHRIPGPGVWGLTGAPNGTDEVYTFGADRTKPLYGPVQQYLWDWDATFDIGHAFPRLGRYILTWGPENGGTLTLIDTAPSAPANPGPGQEWMTGGFQTVDQAYNFAVNYAKTDALQTRQKEYTDIITQEPDANEKGPDFGNSIEGFKHGNIIIDGTQWSYNQNP